MDWIVIVSAAAALLLLALILSSFYFYRVAIGRNSKAYLRGNKDLDQTNESAAQSPEQSEDGLWLDSTGCETWEVTSEDGLRLKAHYVAAVPPSKKAAVLFHGYSSKGKDMAGFARSLHSRGFSVLMPDARGHGESEGRYIGFGWHERRDCLLWIRRVTERLGEDAQILLMGISMGAATVMMASGERLPPQVKAIIEDCGYTSVWAQLGWQLKRIYRLPRFPFLHATSLLTKLRAGYGFKEASALAQVKKCRTPMLFIHGEDDTFVPYYMARELYDACPAEKDIYTVPGAGHGMACAADIPAYESKVSSFIEKYII